MNIFQLPYEARLQSWYDLRIQLTSSDIQTQCIEIDKWWQKAPLVNHHLHIYDMGNWPDPWELLVENTYCYVARALGMCYTLHMLGIDDFNMVEAIDNQGNEVVLVLVDNAKYILNYWPESVVNNSTKDFTIKKTIDVSNLLKKL